MEEAPLGHVCTVNTRSGVLVHMGGIPAAEQRVKKQAVPATLIPPFSVLLKSGGLLLTPPPPATENEILPDPLQDYLADTEGAD